MEVVVKVDGNSMKKLGIVLVSYWRDSKASMQQNLT